MLNITSILHFMNIEGSHVDISNTPSMVVWELKIKYPKGWGINGRDSLVFYSPSTICPTKWDYMELIE